MIVTVASVYWATFAYAGGWVDYTVGGWRSLAFQLNFLSLQLSVRLYQQRQDHRFCDRIPIDIRPRGRRGSLGERQLALTENLNAAGLSFRPVSKFNVRAELNINLPLSTGEVSVNGTVVHVRAAPEAGVVLRGAGLLDAGTDAPSCCGVV